MRRCPRCRTSMIWATGSSEEGFPRVWHCLGCGKETLARAEEQASDDEPRERRAPANPSPFEHIYQQIRSGAAPLSE